MVDIFIIAFYDIRRYFSNIRSILLMLAVPLLIIALILYTISPFFFGNSYVDRFTIAIVDNDGTFDTKFIINHFEQSESLSQVADVVHTDYQNAIRMIKGNQIAAAIVVPENFIYDMSMGKNTPITVIGNSQMPFQAMMIREYMKNAANLVTAAQSGINTIWHFLEEAGASRETLDEWFSKSVMEFSFKSLGRNQIFEKNEVLPLGGVLPFEYYSAAVAAVYILINSMAGLTLIIRDKNSGVIQRMISRGMPTGKIIVSKILALVTYQIVQFSILFAGIIFFTNGFYKGNIIKAILIFIASISVCSSFMIFIGAWLEKLITANVAGYITVIIMAFIGGSIIPLQYLPVTINNLSFLSINKWMINGLIYSIFQDQHEIFLKSILVLLLFSIGFISAAAFTLDRKVRYVR